MSALPFTRDAVTGGEFAVCDGVVYIKTPCCGADATGTSTSPTGVACRSCLAPLHEGFGWAALEALFAADYLAYLQAVAK